MGTRIEYEAVVRSVAILGERDIDHMYYEFFL